MKSQHFFIVVAAVEGWATQDGFERKTETLFFFGGGGYSVS